jgi:hypothetical protein
MAAAPASPTVVALLAMPEVTAATLYGFYDALSSAGRDWQLLHGREPARRCSGRSSSAPTASPWSGANGVRIHVDASFAACPPARRRLRHRRRGDARAAARARP